jgi:hypothetical protein
MKKTILTLAAMFSLAITSQAVIVLSDTFSYSGANLVGASGSPWANHSGTTPITLVNGKARVTSGNSEDANAPLTGAPYDTTNNPAVGNLYAAMSITLSNLPGADGTYLAHFKDNGTFNFRGRLFVLTSGAATGKYRFGIASTNSASTTVGFTPYPQDLDLTTNYTVVVRYNITNGESTLWINPDNEQSFSVTNAPPNPDITVPITTYALRQASGCGTAYIDNLKVGTEFNNVAGTNTSPLISAVLAQSAPMNSVIGPIAFSVEDAEVDPGTLNVTGTSGNTTLVPNGNIVFGGSGASRTVTITPATGQQGSALITLTVSDGVNSTPTTFLVRFGAPSISAIPSQFAFSNTVAGPIAFTVNDPEGDSLTISTNISNLSLVSSVAVGGSGANRTITVTPIAGQVGISTISIYATDGFNSVTQSFAMTFSPNLGLVFSDDFTYPDGILYLTGPWSLTGGTAGQTLVTNNTVLLNRTNSEALNTGTGFGAGAPFAPTNSVVLYSGFTVRFLEIPNASGNYFGLLKDTSSSNFRARVSARTQNASPGHFRIGIANQSADPSVEYPADLSTNTTYLVVSRYNTANGESALWVNPTGNNAPVTATDQLSTMTVHQFGLRQASGMGTLLLDNLKVATSLAQAANIPNLNETLTNAVLNGEVVLSWGSPLFALQAADAVTGPYTTIAGASSPYTNAPSASQKYFRLKY